MEDIGAPVKAVMSKMVATTCVAIGPLKSVFISVKYALVFEDLV